MALSLLVRIAACLALILYARADKDSYWRSERHRSGWDGPFPLQRYSSKGIRGPILNYWQRSAACSDGYTLLAPRGPAVRNAGPMILDSEGHLVWFKEYEYLVTFNVNVYTYKGEKYLTYWTGTQVDGAHPIGVGYMVSFNVLQALYKACSALGFMLFMYTVLISVSSTPTTKKYTKSPA